MVNKDENINKFKNLLEKSLFLFTIRKYQQKSAFYNKKMFLYSLLLNIQFREVIVL